MAKYYIAFDCGTQSTKTAIYDDNAHCVAESSVPTNIEYPQAGWAQMDADHYLESVRVGIRSCIEKSGINPSDVRSICGDGIICGVVGVDSDGRAITPYLPYLDSRGADDAKQLNDNLEPIWIERSGNSKIEAFYPPVYIRWFLKNHEEFKKRGAKFMNNGSYVASRLADLKGDDAFIDWATLSGWLKGYNAIEKTWCEEQMSSLEIPMKYLPKIVKPWDIIGTLSDEEAERTGLVPGIPIVAGAGDTMQSNLGCGLVETGMAADVAGTAAMFTVMVDGINEHLSRNTDLLFSIGTLPDTYFYWGYIRTGGLSLRWFRDNVCGRVSDQSFYDEIEELARQIPQGSNGTLFIPYLQGGSGSLEKACGCFLNMSSGTERGELWRSILESIAFEYLSLVNTLRENGIDIDRVIITEGGSKSSLWNQIKADTLNVDALTLERTEGALMSNFMLAAYAVGDLQDLKESVRSQVRIKESYKPDPNAAEIYKRAFNTQQDLMHRDLKTAFSTLHDWRSSLSIS